ncbi:hypothetical protein [Rhizobium sp. BK602]|uniref:hypothetical protein n=1 Tax=Rhizobium sp. BK602 TaxID=2586986 RepID=UPI001617932A|nr:hypothetical protein [Rhizobium sp. BK602]MBB3611316.1 hypothetical protein [Rhizobium sp. BK602]
MGWKIVAVLSIISYLNTLQYWFSGGYEATILHYFFVVLQLPVTVVTACYAFNLRLASARFWQMIKWAFLVGFIATIIEDIGPLSKTLARASQYPLADFLVGLSVVLLIQILTLVGMGVQYAALSRYIKKRSLNQEKFALMIN